MPWTARDAKKHTKAASSGKKQRQWADVADSAKARGASDVVPIKAAVDFAKKTKPKAKK